MYDEEQLVEAVNATTALSIAIVAEDRKDTLTDEAVIKAMDRIEQMFESGEIVEQLEDPDAPEIGHDDQYVVCAILMYWKLIVPAFHIELDMLLDAARRFRAQVQSEGLSSLPGSRQLVERRAISGEHARIMHEKLEQIFAALAANRNRLDEFSDD